MSLQQTKEKTEPTMQERMVSSTKMYVDSVMLDDRSVCAAVVVGVGVPGVAAAAGVAESEESMLASTIGVTRRKR